MRRSLSGAVGGCFDHRYGLVLVGAGFAKGLVA
jgi:hypothetical protein